MQAEAFGDLRIGYERSGQGPLVLLIQGVGLAGRAWRPQVERLKSEFECLTVDNRGLGQSTGDVRKLSISSMVGDIAMLLDRLQLERVHVVGHSMGGVIAQEFALQHPTRVRSLTFMCTFSRGKDALVPSWIMLNHWLFTSLGTSNARRRAFARMVSSEEYIKKCGIDAVVAELEAVFERSLAQPPKVVGAQLRALSGHDSLARLPELTPVPCLVLSGEKDPIARPLYGRRLAEGIGSARFVEVPDQGHALPIQAPDLVQEELRRHLLGAERSLDAVL
jgi:pimeloyl-ACP methyl ester carboxylesterase